jgi:hypothetical protein
MILGVKPWRNGVIMKFVFFITMSGLITGYDTGTVSILALLLSQGNVVNFDIFGAG